MPGVLYFLAKAAQCRRLAHDIPNRDDPAVSTLLDLAAEFEERASTGAPESESEGLTR
jgi:hypothetical protein